MSPSLLSLTLAFLPVLFAAPRAAQPTPTPARQDVPPPEERTGVIGRIHDLLDEAGRLGSVGQADKGREIMQEVLALWRSPEFPADDPGAVEAVRRIGRLADRLSLYDDAKAAWQYVIERWSRTRPLDDPDLDSVRIAFGLAARSKHDWVTARRVIEDLLEARLAHYPEDSPEVLIVRKYLIDTLVQLKDYPAARDQLEVLYQLQSALIPEGHEDLMRLREQLAFNRYRTGDLEGAAELFEIMLDVLRANAAPDDDALQGTRRNLVQVYTELERYEDAAALQEEGIEQFVAFQGPESARAETMRGELAETLYTLGELPRALRLIERLVGYLEGLGEPNSPELLRSRLHLCELFGAMGHSERAIEEGRRALAGFDTYLPPEHSLRLLAVRLLATEELRAGEVEAATRRLDQALALPTAALPVNDPTRLRLAELREEARWLAGEREAPPEPAEDTRARLAERLVRAARRGEDRARALAADLERRLAADLGAARTPSPGRSRWYAASAEPDLALLLSVEPVGESGGEVSPGPLVLLERSRTLATRRHGDTALSLEALAGALAEGDLWLSLDLVRLGLPGSSEGAGERLVLHRLTPDGDLVRFTRPVPGQLVKDWLAAARGRDVEAEERALTALREGVLGGVLPGGTARVILRPGGAAAGWPLDRLVPDGVRARVVACAADLLEPPAPPREAGWLAVGEVAERALGAGGEDGPMSLSVEPGTLTRFPAAVRRARHIAIALPGWRERADLPSWRELGAFAPPVLEAVTAPALVPGCDPLDLVGLLWGGAPDEPDTLGRWPGVLEARELWGLSLTGVDLVALPAFTDPGDADDLGEAVDALRQALHGAGAATVVIALTPLSEQAQEAFLRELASRLEGGAAPADAARAARAALRAEGRPPADWASLTISGG